MASKKPQSSVPVTDAILASFRPAKKLSYHENASVTCLDFDDSGQYLISSGVDKSIQLYDCYKGVRQKEIQSQKYGAHLAKFAHGDLSCLYASTPVQNGEEPDHSIRHLSLTTKSYLRYFKGHKDQVLSLEMNPVSRTFLSASADHTVKSWDLRTSTPMGSIGTGQAALVAYDPHGIVFAVAKPPLSAFESGSVAFYSVASFERGPFLTKSVPGAPAEVWSKIEFSNNGRHLLIVTDSPQHYILDAISGKFLATLVVDAHAAANWMQFQYVSSGAACFSPDGKHVFAGNVNGNVALFDLSPLKGEDRENVKLRPSHVLASKHGIPKVVAFNPKLLALATADTNVVLWSTTLEE
ncbi:hypothetical protein JCM33374_g4588 [Metschnikowia sp. JCM 33374]|nr:hypothetical protein JCM33374_g4588 [Metschnikowia sp. JCM 33374]